jgi:hypothetical protein
MEDTFPGKALLSNSRVLEALQELGIPMDGSWSIAG